MGAWLTSLWDGITLKDMLFWFSIFACITLYDVAKRLSGIYDVFWTFKTSCALAVPTMTGWTLIRFERSMGR